MRNRIRWDKIIHIRNQIEHTNKITMDQEKRVFWIRIVDKVRVQ